MYLALAILLFQFPATPQAATPQAGQPEAREVQAASAPAPATNSDSSSANEKPSAAPAQPAGNSEDSNSVFPALLPGSSSTEPAAASAASPAPAPLPVGKMSPWAVRRSELRTPKMWYGLLAANHAAATFDAWSTRRVVSTGAGHELNPLLRPFANSGGLYAAMQVAPVAFDFLGRSMTHSRRPWVRRMWWLPQAAGTAASLFSGVHNVHVYHQATAGYAPQY